MFQKGSLLAGNVSGRFRGRGALCKQACEATADRQTRPARRDARPIQFAPEILVSVIIPSFKIGAAQPRWRVAGNGWREFLSRGHGGAVVW